MNIIQNKYYKNYINLINKIKNHHLSAYVNSGVILWKR